MQTVKVRGDKTTIETTCRCCNSEQQVEVNTRDYVDWLKGKLIQDAFPYLDVNQREILISGICSTCFDSVFSNYE